jgi:hypothetical protein
MCKPQGFSCNLHDQLDLGDNETLCRSVVGIYPLLLRREMILRDSDCPPQGECAMHGIDAALIRTVCGTRVHGHVVACKKQLRVDFVFRGFQLPK